MASSSSEHLLSCPWTPVDIGDSQFLCKSWFGQTQYHLLLLDSDGLWEEQMEAEEIQSRAQELNRRLRASVEALVTAVTPCLTGGGSDHVTIQRRDGHMTLRLKSELAGMPFHWEFHCRPAPVATACVQLVRPLLVMSGALQRQTQLLFALLRRKDAEIQDYKENGAQLTRERLQTEPFVEETFRQDFMTKTFPSLLEEQESSLSLDSELQELYASATSRQNANSKRKRSEEEEEEEAEVEEENHQRGDAPAQKEAEKTRTPAPDAKKTTLPTMQQTAPSYPSAADRAAPKPKKKKTGLFR
uniref:Non-homologous end-joining factor 1 n=1 Tax=Neogobius melanostomus TaxID=47308 RepID=A0A8C6UJW7_9GOBI